MNSRTAALAGTILLAAILAGFTHQKGKKESNGKQKDVSYKKTVAPIFKKYCLPCHTEDNMNPSELYLDSYDDIMKGGKHGIPIRAGKPDSSFIVQKLGPKPPFGDPMPYKFKRPFPEDTLAILAKWIEQGAKNN